MKLKLISVTSVCIVILAGIAFYNLKEKPKKPKEEPSGELRILEMIEKKDYTGVLDLVRKAEKRVKPSYKNRLLISKLHYYKGLAHIGIYNETVETRDPVIRYQDLRRIKNHFNSAMTHLQQANKHDPNVVLMEKMIEKMFVQLNILENEALNSKSSQEKAYKSMIRQRELLKKKGTGK